MLWFYLTTFFAIAKIWGGLTFSWWWISLMVFLDLFQFVIDSIISYQINNENIIEEEKEENNKE